VEKKFSWVELVIGALIITLVLALAAGEATLGTFYGLAVKILSFALVVFVIGLGGERGTELLKMVLRFIFTKVPLFRAASFLQPTGAGSAFLALIVALAAAFKFDVNLFTQFPEFAGLDPQLQSLLTVAIVWIAESLVHAAIPAGVGRAQAVIGKSKA